MTRADTASAQRTLAWTLVLLFLLAARLPSLVEPAGADQSLYTYVGQRIDAGDVPYRDVWDQKPPAIHFIYAGLWRLWPHDSVIAAADIIAAGLVAWLLILLGRRTVGEGIGAGAACVFLLFGNPAIQRLSGVRVRAQCETFIAVAVTAALVLVANRTRRPRHLVLAGICLGIAFWLKFNAGVYLAPVLVLALKTDLGCHFTKNVKRHPRSVFWIALGFIAVAAVVLGYFAAHGALTDLWLATISYNLQYSRETYSGFTSVIDYLAFPIDRARIDILWYLGGAGCVILLLNRPRSPFAWAVLTWVAAAALSIMVNGARDLPQYFVQAHPALALAAAAGLAPAFRRHTTLVLRTAILVILAVGLWKVGDEPAAIRLGGLSEAIHNGIFDVNYARGAVSRAAYLSRFQQQTDIKYVPLSAEELTEHVRATTTPADRIFVFGLSADVYVHAPRQSASRFFWSRPIQVEFANGTAGYGSIGLLHDLERTPPALVALQKHWGDPGPRDFFMSNVALRGWLESSYVLDEDTTEFTVWRRKP